MEISAVDLRLSIGGLSILSGVNLFSLRTGEIHGLVGGNGSGKSSFLNLLAGFTAGDARIQGRLEVDGENVTAFYSRRVARALGIYLVSQEPAIVPTLSTLDNLFLGAEATRAKLLIDRRRETMRALSLLEELGWSLDLECTADRLPFSERQKLALCRVLLRDSRPSFLLLDEPTTQLGDDEIQGLFAAIRGLRDRGSGILFVSHKTRDILGIAQRVSVFKSGRIDATFDASDFDTNAFKGEVLGVSESAGQATPVQLGPEILAARFLDAHGREEVAFTISEGELVGLLVDRKRPLGTVIDFFSGLRRPFPGTLRFKERDLAKASVRERRMAGFSFVPALNMEQALFPNLTVQENLLLSISADRPLWIWGRRARQHALELAENFDIPFARLGDELSNMSGGFRQRVLLARELAPPVRVLVLDHPSQGIDFSARPLLLKQIRALLLAGACGLLISSDGDEVSQITSRSVSY